MTREHITGLVAAPFTPMQKDGRLNLAVIEKQVDFLASNGVEGAFVCGTTGEGTSLTTQERKEVATRWSEVLRGRMKLLVHVGHNSIGESCELAAHAKKLGAFAVATTGPSFFRPGTAEGLAEFCAEISKAAPGLGFYFYHMPSMTNIRVPMLDFMRHASRLMPDFAGIKYTDEDLMNYTQCLNFDGGRFNLLYGRDEIHLAALAMGAKGAVGSTYNYMPGLYQKVRAAYQKGDLAAARAHQMKSIEIIDIMIKHGGIPANKAIMKIIGIDCGPVRPPLQNLSAEKVASLEAALRAAGFPDEVNRA